MFLYRFSNANKKTEQPFPLKKKKHNIYIHKHTHTTHFISILLRLTPESDILFYNGMYPDLPKKYGDQ